MAATATTLSAQVQSFIDTANVPVPDENAYGISRTITVPNTADRIGSIRIGIREDQGWDADVDMWLLPPGVTWAGPYVNLNNGPVVELPPRGAIQLSTNNGNNDVNFGTGTGGSTVRMWLTSNQDPTWPTATSVETGAGPFTGVANYVVEGLDAFKDLYGSNPTGDWTLIVADGWAEFTGTLISWEIQFVALSTAPAAATIGRGPQNNPGDAAVPGQTGEVLGQFRLGAAGAAANYTNIRFDSIGSGNLSTNFARIQVWRDNNGDGLLDGGDTIIGDLVAPASVNVTVPLAPAVNVAAGSFTDILLVGNVLATPAAAGVRMQITTAGQVTESTAATVRGVFPVLAGYHPFLSARSATRAPITPKTIRDSNNQGAAPSAGHRDSIVIPATNERIASFRMGFRINHQNLQHLDIYLLPPGVDWMGPYDGTSTEPSRAVLISTDNGGNGNDYGTGTGPYVYTLIAHPNELNPLWDPNEDIVQGNSEDPFVNTPSYQPEDLADLLAVYNTNPTGVWTLAISDDTTGTIGTLLSWFIEWLAHPIADVSGNPDFGNSNVGTLTNGSPRTFTISNDGDYPLLISSINFTGANPGDFALVGAPPASVPAGGSVNIQVNMTPGAAGARTATLNVVCNDQGVAGTTKSVDIYGVGNLGNTLQLAVGASNTPGEAFQFGTVDAVLGQYSATAGSAGASITSVIFRESAGRILIDSLTGLRLYHDVNADGLLDGGDLLLGTATLTAGATSATIPVSIAMPAQTTDNWLLVGDISPAPADRILAMEISSSADLASAPAAVAAFPVNTGARALNPQRIFTSTPPTGLPIPNNTTAGVTDSIVIPATTETVAALRVGLRIVHPDDQDLDLFLLPPGVTWASPFVTPPVGSIELSTDNGGTGNDYGNGFLQLVYADLTSAADPLFTPGVNIAGQGAGSTPFTNQIYRVEDPADWNARYGISPSGTWTLVMLDDAGNAYTSGYLVSWQIEYVPPGLIETTGLGNWGTQQVGLQSPLSPQTYTISNIGGLDTDITGITLAGANAADWSFVGATGAPLTLAEGGSHQVRLNWTPGGIGARNAILRVTYDTGTQTGLTRDFALSGTGFLVGEIAIERPVSTGIADGGPDGIGTGLVGIATPLTYTVRNVAVAGNINLGAVTVTGTVNCGVVITQPGVSLLGPGASTTFQIDVTPAAVGAFSFVLHLANDDTNENPYDINVSGNAVLPPNITFVSPVNHGASNVGVPATTIVQNIGNNGGASLTITAISFVGTNPGDWALVGAPGLPAVVFPAGNLPLNVSFTPTAVGARSAQLRIVSNTGGVAGTVTLINLTGTGTLASIGVTTPVNYGSSNVGVQTGPTNHQVNSTGSGPMRITNIALAGTNPGDWALSGLPAFPATVNNGNNIIFTGRFTPTAVGARTATIQITWDQGAGVGSTVTSITLNGTGTLAAIGVTTPVNYGSSNVGVQTGPTNHQVNSTGSGPMRITNIALAGTNPGDWALSGLPAFPATVNNGNNISFTGRFTPAAVGARTATIQITWDQGAGVGTTITSITLNGTGTLATIGVTTPVNYGNSNVGVQTAPSNHQINNTGTGQMRITNIALAGTSPGDWALSGLPAFPATVNNGSNIVISGQFTPSAIGARTATIQITWDQGAGVGSTVTSITLNGTGTLAAIGVTTPVNYGSSNVGVTTTPATNHQIDNSGTGSMRVTNIALAGTNPGDWALSGLPSFPHTIANGGNLVISGQFTPAAVGARAATIQITWDQGAGVGSTVTSITLNGSGTQATIGVTTPVNYGSSNVGVQTGPVSHQVDSTGSGPMRITNIALAGANAADWALFGLPAFPATVNNGSNVSFTGRFTPAAVGARTATIQITWDQGAGVGSTITSITLNGNGTIAAIGITTPVNYGSSNVGVQTAPVNHQIDSIGTGPMRITAIALTGANAGDWVLNGLPAFPHSVAGGGNLTIDGQFSPSATGVRTATIQITWDQGAGVGSTVTSITLNGTGTLGAIGIVSPVNYGSSNVGVQTAPVNHQIDNNGSGDIEITAIALAGANAGDWVLNGLPGFPHTITAAGNLTINGQFTPTATGARGALIDITWNQAGGGSSTVTSITLNGTGTLAAIGVTTPVNYGSSNVGVQTAPVNHQIDNSGTGPMRITAIALAGANAGDWALSGLPVFPHVVVNGGNLTISGQFTPSATGGRAATAEITWDQGGGVGSTVTSITLSGNGTIAAIGITTPVNYGSSNVGVQTGPVSHQIDNSGTGPMRITAIALTGTNAGDWVLNALPAFPHTVAASGDLTIDGQFTPSATGARTATIEITWDQGAGVGSTLSTITLNGNGTLGAVSVTTPVNYGSSNVGVQTAPVNHQIDNNGSGAIEITAIALSGTNAGDWILNGLPGFPHTVAAAGNLTINGQFTPSATGARTALIDITWNQAGGGSSTVTSITLSGTGTLGAIGVTTPVNYGSSNVGLQTAPVNHQIDSSGTGQMRITSIALAGTNAGDWALSGLPVFPHMVANGGNLTISGQFTPSATGARTATIDITWDQGGGVGSTVTIITLNGNGTLAAIGVTTPVNYGSSNVGVQTAPVNHQIDNSGSGPMRITGISLTGTNAGDWALSGLPAFPHTVGNGGNLTVSGQFTPSATGARTATIEITWDQGGGVGSTVTSITLNGNGTLAAISVTTPVGYGDSNVGVQTAPLNHQIDNSGTGPMRITGIALAGTNPSDWALSGLPSFPHSIANGGNLVISGQFTPAVIGARSATIQITWDQGAGIGGTVTSITLNGNGTTGALSATSPVAYGSIPLGTTSPSQNHQLDNPGTGPTRITGISLTGADAADWALSGLPGFPHTISASGNLVISGQFTPSGVGAHAAQIEVSWDQGAGVGATTTLIDLTGTGIPGGEINIQRPAGTNIADGGTDNGPTGVVGVATNLVYTVQNAGGTADLAVGAVSVTGAFNCGVVITQPVASSLGIGASTTFQIDVTPAAAGGFGFVLHLANNDNDENPYDITYSATAVTAPNMTFVSPVDHGDSNVNVPAATVVQNIGNNGGAALTITSITFVGTNPGDWALLSPVAPPPNIVIFPSGNVPLNVRFTPTAAGARSAQLRIVSNTGGTAGTITLIDLVGNGTQAAINVTTPVDYGDSNVGVQTAPVNHQIDNAGDGPMEITAIALTGANAADWVLNGLPSFPHSVAGPGNLTINGQFTPGALGARTANIEISWNQGGGIGATTATIVLDGNGTQAVIGVTTPVDYGDSNLAVTTAPVNHVIDNNGSGPMEITGISLTGANAGDWVLNGLPGFPHSIASLGDLTINGQFTPGATGARTANIEIDWNQGGGVAATTTTIVLSGNGTQAILSVTTPVNYGSSNVGVQTALVPHQIDNSGTGPLDITAIALNGTHAGDWALFGVPVLPIQLTGGSNLTIDGRFSPTATGARTASIDITWDDGTGPVVSSIVLNGTGTTGLVSSATPVSYGTVVVGASSGLVGHAINNTGTGDARITAIALTGPDAAAWALSSLPGFPHTLVSLTGSHTIDGEFTPSVPGLHTAAIEITWDNGAGTGSNLFTIDISGTGQIPSSVTNVVVGADDGGPVRVQGDVNGPVGSFADIAVTYSGGSNPGAAVISSAGGFTVVGNVIMGVPVNTTLVFYWDAYATEGHTTASDYVITLSPSISGSPGTPGSSAMFTLTRDGNWTKTVTPADIKTAVSEHCMIHDTASDRLLVFGGYRGSTLSNDVWTFDFGNNTWHKLNPAGTPPSPRREVMGIYDGARNRLVVFGGQSSSGNTNNTFALDLTPGAEAWTQIAMAAPLPPVRTGGTLVLDAATDRAILYGGYNAPTVRNDVWALDLTTDSWGAGALTTAGTSPGGLVGQTAVVDPTGGRMVVYGGTNNGTKEQVWELTLGVTPTWALLLSGGGPGPRAYLAHGFDSTRRSLVVEGGFLSNVAYSDAWRLDLASLTWQQLPDEPQSANGRFWAAGVYDAPRDRFVVVGGRDTARRQTDTMAAITLSGTPAWEVPPDMPSDAAGPQPRFGATMVNDSVNNRAILWGGRTAALFFDEMWELDRSGPALWSKLSITGTAPVTRAFAGTALDSAANRLIVFGGQATGGGLVNDVWTLDMNGAPAWTQWTSAGGPSGRQGHAVAYDSSRDRLMVFGGSDGTQRNDFWVYDFATMLWSQPATTGTTPTARQWHGATYDSVNDRFIVFCGLVGTAWANDVHALNLNTLGWADVSAAGTTPTGRYLFASAPAAGGSQVYVHGGKSSTYALSDSWRLDVSGGQATWTQLATPTGPVERHMHSACLDNAGNLVIGFGEHQGRPLNDAWAMDTSAPGNGWQALAMQDAPPSILHSMVAYDEANQRMIVFGGLINGAHSNGLWQLDLAANPPVWSALSAAGQTPAPRRASSFVYDAGASPPRMIMYGGRLSAVAGTSTNEVWALELTPGAEQWVQLTPTIVNNPGVRTYHTAVVDSARRMFVFGGTNGYDWKLNDTYMLDLVTLTWTKILAGGTLPTQRWGHGAIYDGLGGRNRMMVYGGNANPGIVGDTWELDLTTFQWSVVATSGTAPGAVHMHSQVLDPAGQRMLVFGGRGVSLGSRRLFSLNLATNTWTEHVGSVATPQARWGHSAVWDTVANRMVASGGYGDGSVVLTQESGAVSDTWFWGD